MPNHVDLLSIKSIVILSYIVSISLVGYYMITTMKEDDE